MNWCNRRYLKCNDSRAVSLTRRPSGKIKTSQLLPKRFCKGIKRSVSSLLTFDRFVNKTCCDCFVLNFDLERSRQCLDNEQSCPKVVKPVQCLDWSQICRKLCDQEAPFCPDCRDGAVFKVFRRCNYGAGKKLHCDRMHTKVFCFKNFCCHFFRALSKNHASVDKVKNLSCGSKPVLMQWVWKANN